MFFLSFLGLQAKNEDKGPNGTSAINGRIVEVTFSASEDNTIYGDLIRRLADDTETAVRQQLSDYG